MSIISSNYADIKSVIQWWFRENAKIEVKLKVVKKDNGKISYIEVEGDVTIENYQDSTLPFYIGYCRIKGNFTCSYCNISSLSGFPSRILSNFTCSSCPNLNSLNGMPKYIGGDCIMRDCGTIFTEEEIMNICDVTGSIYLK